MYNFDHDLELLSLDAIRIGANIKNIRTQFDEEGIRNLASSIYNDGLMTPITVVETTDPRTGEDILELVAGARRCRAVAYILESIDKKWSCDSSQGVGLILAQKLVGSLEDAEVYNGVENLSRSDVDEVDVAAWLHRMMEINGFTIAKLAEKVSRSESWVNQRIMFHTRACDELKQALRDGVLGVRAAQELARKLSAEDQCKMVKKARKNEETITQEEATHASNRDRVSRPGRKQLLEALNKAEEAAKQGDAYPNAFGVAAGIKFGLGALSVEEIEEIIEWKNPKSTTP